MNLVTWSFLGYYLEEFYEQEGAPKKRDLKSIMKKAPSPRQKKAAVNMKFRTRLFYYL